MFIVRRERVLLRHGSEGIKTFGKKDAVRSDDGDRIRLLLRKLSTLVHTTYVNYILCCFPI